MTTIRSLVLALTCVAVAGCAPSRMRSLSGYDECHGHTCNLRVAVTNCRLGVDPKTLLIVGRNVESTIHWKLDGPASLRFPGNGIEFKGGTPGDFKDCGPTGNGNQFTCKNLHKDAGAWKYLVRVEGQCNGQPVPPLDPFIMND